MAAAAGFGAGVVAAAWLLQIDREVVSRFEGRRFDVPSRVFSAPLIVYPGTEWQRVDLRGWLRRLGYRDQPEGVSFARVATTGGREPCAFTCAPSITPSAQNPPES